MTKKEYLLVCLMEECAEVAHRASKALRFGLEEKEFTGSSNNQERLEGELDDLMGVLSMLEGEGMVSGQNNLAVVAKIKKVERLMEYSKERGCLQSD